MANPSREDLAWAAGLFEGEGSFSLHATRGRLCPVVQLGMTDEDVVRRWAALFGIKVYGPYQRGSYLPVWRANSERFETVQAVGAMLWGWLGHRRRNAFARVMSENTVEAPRSRYGK